MTLDEMRVVIASSLNSSYKILVIAIPVLIGFMLFLLTGGLGIAKYTIDRLALVASLQIGLGMFLGFMCLYFGVMMTWIGIESAYDLTGSAEAPAGRKAAFALHTAAPGLLFGLVGAILIGLSLYKPIEFKETRPVDDTTATNLADAVPLSNHLTDRSPSNVVTVTPDLKLPSTPNDCKSDNPESKEPQP